MSVELTRVEDPGAHRDHSPANDRRIDFDVNHNVYVLGAGFSRVAGFPLMADFLQRMRHAHSWWQEKDASQAEAIRTVLEFRLRSAAAAHRINLDVENVEHLFSLASASNDPALDQAMPRALCATLHYTQQTSRGERGPIQLAQGRDRRYPTSWERRAPPPNTGIGPVLADIHQVMVGRMLGWTPDGQQGRNTLISLNYDLVVEDALRGLGMRWDYGFTPSERDAPSATDRQTASLLKLHGSMNWTMKGPADAEPAAQPAYEAVLESGAPPIVVPPTWRKSFPEAMGNVWNRAISALRTATRIVIIGFSIPDTDLHFKYLLAAALMQNISLETIDVVAVGAGSPEFATRLASVFRADRLVRLHDTTAEAYLAGISDPGELHRPTPWTVNVFGR